MYEVMDYEKMLNDEVVVKWIVCVATRIDEAERTHSPDDGNADDSYRQILRDNLPDLAARLLEVVPDGVDVGGLIDDIERALPYTVCPSDMFRNDLREILSRHLSDASGKIKELEAQLASVKRDREAVDLAHAESLRNNKRLREALENIASVDHVFVKANGAGGAFMKIIDEARAALAPNSGEGADRE